MRLLLIVMLLFLAAAELYAQEGSVKQTTDSKVVAVTATPIKPGPDFSVSYGIVSRLKLDDGPVKLTSNENRKEDGPGMSKVGIENVSDKAVKAIKLNWYLYDDPNSAIEIKRGQGKQIDLDVVLPGATKVVASKLPSFDELFKGLARDGYVKGTYYVEAVIGEVEYADGTRWTREDDKSP